MEPEKCPEWLWKSVDELLPLDLFLPLSNLLRRPLNLAVVTENAGLVVRHFGIAGAVTIKWDSACDGGYQLAHRVLTLPYGRDVSIFDASPDNVVFCRFDIVVPVDDPKVQQKTVEWPLGRDLVLLPFEDSNGVKHEAKCLSKLSAALSTSK